MDDAGVDPPRSSHRQRSGYEALTVEAVAAEAGAYRDSVRYYFGSKTAFIAAVVDSLAHDQSLKAYTETPTLPAGDQRVHSMLASDRRPVSYTHLRAHETPEHLVCRLLLE